MKNVNKAEQDTTQDFIKQECITFHAAPPESPADTVGLEGSVAEMERSLAALKHSVEQFRSLVDNVPGTVARIDLTGKYLFVNKFFLELTGLSADQVVGHGVEVIQPFIEPAFFPKMVEAVTTTMREQRKTMVEFWGTDAQGMRRCMVQMAHPWFDHTRTFAGIEILTLDITQKKSAEEQLSKYQQKLQRLVDQRTAKLKQAVEQLSREKAEREQAQKALAESEKKLHITALRRAGTELEEQNRLLQEKNIALREVMGQLESEKKRIAQTIKSNIERLVLPLLDKIRIRSSEDATKYLYLLEENLRDITAGFGISMSSAMYKLTQREIEICDMVRRGLSCKEIGRLQNISSRTVETHRTRIRKKLGITNAGVNLATYLKTL